MVLGAGKSYCPTIPVDRGAVLFEPIHSQNHTIVTECDELEGVYFKVFGAGLHNKTSGVVRGVDGSIGERNIESLVNNGELMYFGEVLVNKRNRCSRVNHCIDREGRSLEVEGDRNCDGSRVEIIVGTRRRVVKGA